MKCRIIESVASWLAFPGSALSTLATKLAVNILVSSDGDGSFISMLFCLNEH